MFCSKCGYENDDLSIFCASCGESLNPEAHTQKPKKLKRKKVGSGLIILIVIIVVVVIGFMIYFSFYEDDENDIGNTLAILNELSYTIKPVGYFDDMSLFYSETMSDKEWFSHIQYYDVEEQEYLNENNQFPNKEGIFSSVVKIVCEDEEFFYYGSGTSMDPSGYVLTNHHVVEDLTNDACIVGFPDPTLGLIREAYWTSIIIDKENETGHDLAYLSIEMPVVDDKGNIYGYYDTIENGSFPYFEHDDECLNTPIRLGDEILVLGYPLLSGEALTITNGLVSSLYSPSGYIITSAKIISGISGGLGIDVNGCYIGVPTASYLNRETDDEALGEIIDWEFVAEFEKAIEDDLEEYYQAENVQMN